MSQSPEESQPRLKSGEGLRRRVPRLGEQRNYLGLVRVLQSPSTDFRRHPNRLLAYYRHLFIATAKTGVRTDRPNPPQRLAADL